MSPGTEEILAEVVKVASALAVKAVELAADAHAGKVDPADALAKLKGLTSGLAANDAAANEALHERFAK